MSEFSDVNLTAMIERGVPPKLASDAIEILERQNEGLLPVPLEGEELHIVNSAWTWMTTPEVNAEPKT
jgi:hypothetical protein